MFDSIYLHFSVHTVILLQSLRFEKSNKKANLKNLSAKYIVHVYRVNRPNKYYFVSLCVQYTCSLHNV